MMRCLARRSLVLATVLAASPSLAGDPAVAPSSTAKTPGVDAPQALFDAGLADMEAGRFEKACPAIEASQRLDPRPGTLFTLAECEAQRGRVATAMRYYAEYLALYRNFNAQKKAEQKERATTSEAQIKRLGLLVPRLTLVLDAGADPDVIIKRDGEIVADLSLGTALPVDPGEHVITTESPGAPISEQRISVAPGESKTLRIRPRPAAGPLSTATVTALVGPAPIPSSSADPEVARALKIAGWTAGAVGVAGLALGIVTAVLAFEQRELVTRYCEPVGADRQCTPEGIAAGERVRQYGAASTVGFVTAGVGLGLGLGLVLAATSMPTPIPGVGPVQARGLRWQSVGLRVGGSF